MVKRLLIFLLVAWGLVVLALCSNNSSDGNFDPVGLSGNPDSTDSGIGY